MALWFREFMFITWEDHIGAIFSFEFPDVKLTDIFMTQILEGGGEVGEEGGWINRRDFSGQRR